MALDDRFRIGSNTKTFVATVLLQLVDEKKLTLDDTVAHFNLGLNVPNENKLTLRQLAEMRSGIIDMYAIPGVQKRVRRVGQARRGSGSRWPPSSRRCLRPVRSTTTATPTGSCSGSSSKK